MNKEEQLISIIVPVYNCENYLTECLNSIVNQTYKNLQIILVDDGSKDSSGQICDKFAANDLRIKVFHIKNGGPSKARNLGLENSTGKYVYFCDSDDYMQPNMISTLYNHINAQKVNMVMCGYLQHNKKSSDIHTGKNSEIVDINNPAKLIEYFFSPTLNLSALWNKMYKKDAIGNTRFPCDLSWGEDQVFNYKFLTNNNTFYFCKETLYNYNSKYSSLSVKLLKDYIHKTVVLCKYRHDFLKNNNITDKKMIQLVYWSELRPLFAGVYHESKFKSKKEVKQNLLTALNNECIAEAIKNFSPKNLQQKLIYYCLKHKKINFICLIFKIRNLGKK